MKSFVAAIGALAWTAASASAQPERLPGAAPAENVIVTAPHLAPEEVIRGYIQSYAAPSPALGKIARWRDRICPVTTGLPPGENAFVTRRVKQVAAMAGAPVRRDEACRANIDIVFTFNPQMLLDAIRNEHPMLLGYHNAAQAGQLAHVSYAVQAWYTTQTADLHGVAEIDDKQHYKSGFYVATAFGTVHVPDANVAQVTGDRLADGLSSELYHVVIAVDLGQLRDSKIGPVADYVAMLALSQTQAYDSCVPVASITNLLASGCDAAWKPEAVTDMDLAYLKGLYDLAPGRTLQQQRGDIAYVMRKSLEGR